MNVFRIALIAVLLTSLPVFAEEPKPLKAAKSDKCPVCGMFVAKYPDFLAQVIFRDGAYALFDGAKDMFKYYFNLKKYNPSKELSDIAVIYVTDYYSITRPTAAKPIMLLKATSLAPWGENSSLLKKNRKQRNFWWTMTEKN